MCILTLFDGIYMQNSTIYHVINFAFAILLLMSFILTIICIAGVVKRFIEKKRKTFDIILVCFYTFFIVMGVAIVKDRGISTIAEFVLSPFFILVEELKWMF